MDKRDELRELTELRNLIAMLEGEKPKTEMPKSEEPKDKQSEKKTDKPEPKVEVRSVRVPSFEEFIRTLLTEDDDGDKETAAKDTCGPKSQCKSISLRPQRPKIDEDDVIRDWGLSYYAGCAIHDIYMASKADNRESYCRLISDAINCLRKSLA